MDRNVQKGDMVFVQIRKCCLQDFIAMGWPEYLKEFPQAGVIDIKPVPHGFKIRNEQGVALQ